MDPLAETKRIILNGLKGHPVRVYLFGSRAEGAATRISDIDVGVLPLRPLPDGLLSEIREELEESRIPLTVDLVDLSEADPKFRKAVQREGLLWTA